MTVLVFTTIFILLCGLFFFLTNSLCASMEEDEAFRQSIYATLCLLAVIAIVILYGTHRARELSRLDAELPCLSVPCYEESCIHNSIHNSVRNSVR